MQDPVFSDGTLKGDGTSAKPLSVAVPSIPTTPGGANTQVQFNDNGAFGGDARLTWNKATGSLSATIGATGQVVIADAGPNVEIQVLPGAGATITLFAGTEQTTFTNNSGTAVTGKTFTVAVTASMQFNAQTTMKFITPAGAVGLSLQVAATGRIGFYGAAPIVQPTVTGSKTGGAALASLLTQLALIGIIVDGTSA
jgi:hypothetical protein